MKRISLAILIVLICAGMGWGQTAKTNPLYGLRQSDGSAVSNGMVPTYVAASKKWVAAAVSGTGDVTGPAGATAGNFPLLDATGKILTDSTTKPADFLLKTIGTEKGTLVGFSAANTPVTIPKGTDGQVLAWLASGTGGFQALDVPAWPLGWTNIALVAGTGGPAAKNPPVDADFFYLGNSESSNAHSYVTGTNLKAYLKTYNDTLYSPKGTTFDPAVADHAYSGQYFTATAGENVAIGDTCYMKSDGKYWKAKADATSTMTARVTATGTISANATGVFLSRGFLRDDSWSALTVGGDLFVSAATAGLITQSKPATSTNIVQIIGYAYAAKVMFVDHNSTFVTVP